MLKIHIQKYTKGSLLQLKCLVLLYIINPKRNEIRYNFIRSIFLYIAWDVPPVHLSNQVDSLFPMFVFDIKWNAD